VPLCALTGALSPGLGAASVLTVPATMLPRVTGMRLEWKNWCRVTGAPAGGEGGRGSSGHGESLKPASLSAHPNSHKACKLQD